MPNQKGRLVYSTRSGDLRRAVSPAPVIQSPPPSQQTARLALDRSHRRGKVVTVVSNLVLSQADLEALARALKTLCGAGGTIKDGTIEVQGDHREKIADHLAKLGYKVKRVGG